MHSQGDKYMDWHVGKEMADYLKEKGCNVLTDFDDSGNHVKYGIFSHIAQTMLYVEYHMKDGVKVAEQILNDISDKVSEYLENEDYSEETDISL